MARSKISGAKVSLTNALFSLLVTAGLAAQAGVANDMLAFATSKLVDLGQFGVMPWAVGLTTIGITGAIVTNGLRVADYGRPGYAAVAGVFVAVASLSMWEPLNTAVTGSTVYGLVVVGLGTALYFGISYAAGR